MFLETNFANIVVDYRDGILGVTLNRPQVLNALNRATLEELAAVVAYIQDRARPSAGAPETAGNAPEARAIGAVIITGAGEKAFAAGADISELAQVDPLTGHRYASLGSNLLSSIESLPIPVIAAVNGFALGGGLELAMACHMRVASPNAKVGQPEVKLGLIPGYGGTQRLPRLIGKGRALELLLTGKSIGADEALRIGLFNAVVPAAELMETARKWAMEIMSVGPLAVRACLEAVSRGMELSTAEGCRLEVDLFTRVCATEDMKEGTRAFVEKRRADFQCK
ncbi:MAG: enoyl-CoA hydratase/isomerase family protein [Candidatus Schekmanbacteria bacterium]|nr:enoyl-CoA hydratase/isomerase family protein [Candidatus Schekmanbacteria bacterium]